MIALHYMLSVDFKSVQREGCCVFQGLYKLHHNENESWQNLQVSKSHLRA